MNTPRTVDITNVYEQTLCKIDNYFPCLCNGKITNGINKEWNSKNWNIEFHIIDKNTKVLQNVIDIISKKDVAISFTIYQENIFISEGCVVYNITTGKILYFESCNKNDVQNDVKIFMINIINLFAEINYIEWNNAIHRSNILNIIDNDDSRKSHNIPNKKINFVEQKEQPAYTPKKRTNQRTIKHRNTFNIETAVYKVECWERAGYYRRSGIYVRPHTCHRHAS